MVLISTNDMVYMNRVLNKSLDFDKLLLINVDPILNVNFCISHFLWGSIGLKYI